MSARKSLMDRLFDTTEEPPDMGDSTPPPPPDLAKITGGGGGSPTDRYEPRYLYIIPGTGFIPLWRRRWTFELLNYCFGNFAKQWEPVQEALEIWKVPVQEGPNGELLLHFNGSSNGWGKPATVDTLRQLQQSGEVIIDLVTVVTCTLPQSPCDIWPNNERLGLPKVPDRFWNAPLSQLPLDDHWPPERDLRIPFESDTGKPVAGMPALDLVWPARRLYWDDDTPVPNVNEIGVMAGVFHTGRTETQNCI